MSAFDAGFIVALGTWMLLLFGPNDTAPTVTAAVGSVVFSLQSQTL